MILDEEMFERESWLLHFNCAVTVSILCVVGWSAVCDIGISRSYSLALFSAKVDRTECTTLIKNISDFSICLKLVCLQFPLVNVKTQFKL